MWCLGYIGIRAQKNIGVNVVYDSPALMNSPCQLGPTPVHLPSLLPHWTLTFLHVVPAWLLARHLLVNLVHDLLHQCEVTLPNLLQCTCSRPVHAPPPEYIIVNPQIKYSFNLSIQMYNIIMAWIISHRSCCSNFSTTCSQSMVLTQLINHCPKVYRKDNCNQLFSVIWLQFGKVKSLLSFFITVVFCSRCGVNTIKPCK